MKLTKEQLTMLGVGVSAVGVLVMIFHYKNASAASLGTPFYQNSAIPVSAFGGTPLNPAGGGGSSAGKDSTRSDMITGNIGNLLATLASLAGATGAGGTDAGGAATAAFYNALNTPTPVFSSPGGSDLNVSAKSPYLASLAPAGPQYSLGVVDTGGNNGSGAAPAPAPDKFADAGTLAINNTIANAGPIGKIIANVLGLTLANTSNLTGSESFLSPYPDSLTAAKSVQEQIDAMTGQNNASQGVTDLSVVSPFADSYAAATSNQAQIDAMTGQGNEAPAPSTPSVTVEALGPPSNDNANAVNDNAGAGNSGGYDGAGGSGGYGDAGAGGGTGDGTSW